MARTTSKKTSNTRRNYESGEESEISVSSGSTVEVSSPSGEPSEEESGESDRGAQNRRMQEFKEWQDQE